MTIRWTDNRNILLLAAGILALGIIVGGYLLGDGLRRSRMADRSVTMRGLAERNVTADLATWTLVFSESGSELGATQAAIDEKGKAVRGFFRRYGFTDADVADTGTSTSQSYDKDRAQNVATIRQSVQLRTRDVMKARAAFARQADLIRSGVPLEDGSGMVYSFTKLNDVKPQMIAEATRNARNGAEQFARDSGTSVGGIKQATQGYFSVGARDGDAETDGGGSAGGSPFQKVRVVTTIDFYLG